MEDVDEVCNSQHTCDRRSHYYSVQVPIPHNDYATNLVYYPQISVTCCPTGALPSSHLPPVQKRPFSPSEVDKFRTISLLNVEGKIYFAMRADRLLQFVQDNKYIDLSIQKGGLVEISGCLEHTDILSQLIREAKAEKKDLVITRMYLANV